jgi:hypothetical protein
VARLLGEGTGPAELRQPTGERSPPVVGPAGTSPGARMRAFSGVGLGEALGGYQIAR